MIIDTVELARRLIRCPSVTPADEGALDTLQEALEQLGFTCRRLPFQEPGTDRVDNLYARLETDGAGPDTPNLCFAGHTDVVPVGNPDAWSVDPFAGEIIDGVLYGRGAVDMKGAIAAYVAGLSRYLDAGGQGSFSLLITGDEERDAINGTRKVLEWMAANGQRIDHCLVGEPTNPNALGEMVKIGRRGSISGFLTVYGTQGHTAYPHLADNPMPRLLRMLSAITEHELDRGTDYFQPSNLEVTTIDVGNTATNVIPGIANAVFNIRFNDLHTSASLEKWLRETFDAVGGKYDLRVHVTGEAFLTEPGPFSDLISTSIERVIGRKPELSTTGGTSDARFIKDYCPVAEFGLISQTMHKVDERVPLDMLDQLSRIYEGIVADYAASSSLGRS